jgi:hypothetical protein
MTPHIPEVTMREHGLLKRTLSAATDNWLSRSYLALCAGLLIWVAAGQFHGNDASFAGVWPIVATLPVSLLAAAVASGAGLVFPSVLVLPLFIVLISAAAFLNATLLGLLVRSLRHRGNAHA